MRIFTPNHVQLLNACYPPASILLAAGSDYSPSSHELSRLTYYASNHPGKLTKLGSELDKRIKTESKRARAGYVRSRASLLVSLTILRALTIECRRDLQLFSGPLMSSVDATLSNVPADLEVVSRATGVFTAWATYTDGHLVGVDAAFTQDYLTVLGHFAKLSCTDAKDQEVQNRTRLIGMAALNGAVNSEALYYNSSQFSKQVYFMMRPVLSVTLHAPLNRLDEQATDVKETPLSPYFAEFRARPAAERRTASIHVHIDGDTGPSAADVTDAYLRVLFTLLSHSNSSQLGQITQSTFDAFDTLQAWSKVDYCCWFAKRMAEWAQYQYRYVVPTWLVERLSKNQDVSATSPPLRTLLEMITAVLDAPIPLVDLSSSDLLSSLVAFMLRRIAKDPQDVLVPAVVSCIASLGRHVYYSDQIQDLATEMVNRLTIVEMQGISGATRHHHDPRGRIEAIRSLLAALRGLIHAANNQEKDNGNSQKDPVPDSNGARKTDDPQFRRTRVPADIWHDTLSLLCDKDYAVRADYADVLVFYLTDEMPKQGDVTSSEPAKRPRASLEVPTHQIPGINVVVHGGDTVMKVIHAIHAYLYVLSMASLLGFDSGPTPPLSSTPSDHSVSAVAQSEQQAPRLRKVSKVQQLTEHIPQSVSGSSSACVTDYAHILRVLTAVYEQTPVRALFAGVPMLLALDASTRIEKAEDCLTAQRIFITREVVARAWMVLGEVWECEELTKIVEKALSTMPRATMILNIECNSTVSYQAPPEPVHFSPSANLSEYQWTGLNSESALGAIARCRNVQRATGLQTDVLISRFTARWSVDAILRDSFDKTPNFEHSIRGDGVSPLLKISPALMHDNMSLHSLARSARAVGVTDLREALEGRSSMSNSALAGAPSFSTLEHASSHNGDRSRGHFALRTKRQPPSGTREVRDVLNRLGIGKQNANLLRASFPALQRSSQKVPPYKV